MRWLFVLLGGLVAVFFLLLSYLDVNPLFLDSLVVSFSSEAPCEELNSPLVSVEDSLVASNTKDLRRAIVKSSLGGYQRLLPVLEERAVLAACTDLGCLEESLFADRDSLRHLGGVLRRAKAQKHLCLSVIGDSVANGCCDGVDHGGYGRAIAENLTWLLGVDVELLVFF